MLILTPDYTVETVINTLAKRDSACVEDLLVYTHAPIDAGHKPFSVNTQAIMNCADFQLMPVKSFLAGTKQAPSKRICVDHMHRPHAQTTCRPNAQSASELELGTRL